MPDVEQVNFVFDNSFARLPDRFYARVLPTPVAQPALLALNHELAATMGLSSEELKSPSGVEILAGNRIPEGADPIAQAYAGHQFGGFVPQLGDGRAILLGEVLATDGRRYDVQLKGSGRTPFSRNGDGRAAIGPVIREFLLSESMAHLGVPTTRALAAVTTGEFVERQTRLPGAVLTRVASSHLRVGTFQYFAARHDLNALQQLTDYALCRHFPETRTRDPLAVQLLGAVIAAQARLIAKWQALGFVHGVMNTDNTTISGETIDYGPCAFLDGFDSERVFSSIDHGGRYSFANQPRMAHFNLSCLAQALLPLVDEHRERAVTLVTEQLDTFPLQFNEAYEAELRRKLGLLTAREGDLELARSLMQQMADERVDYTLCFRQLGEVARTGDDRPLAGLFSDAGKLRGWLQTWQQRRSQEGRSADEQQLSMMQANPAFIPRNHRVEEAITAATVGDLLPFERLRRTLADPYQDQPEAYDLALPPGASQWDYQTFCGT